MKSKKTMHFLVHGELINFKKQNESFEIGVRVFEFLAYIISINFRDDFLYVLVISHAKFSESLF